MYIILSNGGEKEDSSSVSWLLEGLLDIETPFILIYCCYTLHTSQYMLCIAAIVDRTHVHHVVHLQIIIKYHTVLLLLTATHIGSVTATFEDLVTLHRITLQQIFW